MHASHDARCGVSGEGRNAPWGPIYPTAGRVVAIYGIIFRGGPAIGGLTMGWLAESTGLRWPVAGGGLLCVLVWLWVVGRLPNIRSVLESGIEERSEK